MKETCGPIPPAGPGPSLTLLSPQGPQALAVVPAAVPPAPRSPRLPGPGTHLAMNRASEWRQATKRPLMMSIFLAVD